jgi:hypothetical protein
MPAERPLSVSAPTTHTPALKLIGSAKDADGWNTDEYSFESRAYFRTVAKKMRIAKGDLSWRPYGPIPYDQGPDPSYRPAASRMEREGNQKRSTVSGLKVGGRRPHL